MNKYQRFGQKYFSIQVLLNEIEELEFSIMNRFFVNSLEILEQATSTKTSTQRELVNEFKSARKNRVKKSQILDGAIQEKLLFPSLSLLGDALTANPRGPKIEALMDSTISAIDLYQKTLETYRDKLKQVFKDLCSKDTLN